jgi:hypothetical protein
MKPERLTCPRAFRITGQFFRGTWQLGKRCPAGALLDAPAQPSGFLQWAAIASLSRHNTESRAQS